MSLIKVVNIILSFFSFLLFDFLLVFLIPLSSIGFRFVVLKHNPVLHLLGLDVLQLLCLDNIAKISTVAI